MKPLDVPRTSVGNSSASRRPQREARARGGDDGDHRGDPEQRVVAGEEERGLEGGRDQQPHDGHRTPAPALGEAAGQQHADDAGQPAVTVRNTATSEFEKSWAWVR